MNITSERLLTIFKNEYEGKTFYSTSISKKLQDGTYENGTIGVQFKKGLQVDDKQKIYLKSAWLSFYKKDKKTIPFIFINDFTTPKDETTIKVDEIEIDPFEDFGEKVDIEDNFLD